MNSRISFLTQEQKQKAVNDIIAYFLDERGEEIGIIAAEKMLEIFTENLIKPIYNKAVKDIMKMVEEKYTDLQVDVNSLTGVGDDA